MIVEIKGVEFENKGASLMLYAIIDQMTKMYSDAEFVLSPSEKSGFLERSKTLAWQKLALRKSWLDLNFLSYWVPQLLRQKLRRWGIVTEADVDIIIDASGFSYSDQWPSKLRIYHLKNELHRFFKKGKPYIFMPQAFGPFTHKSSIKRIAKSFKYATMINARDIHSFENICGIIGSAANLHQNVDFTNLVKGHRLVKSGKTKKSACIVLNKNMVNSRNSHLAWLDTYEDVVLKAIDCYQERGFIPFFLNHEGADDRSLIDQINNALVSPLSVVEEADPLVVKGIIAASDAVFCSRYHGCVSALSNGIPCIGTSWSHKYDSLYDDYNARKFLLHANIDKAQLVKVIDASLAFSAMDKAMLDARSTELKEQSMAMWEYIKVLIDSSNGQSL